MQRGEEGRIDVRDGAELSCVVRLKGMPRRENRGGRIEAGKALRPRTVAARGRLLLPQDLRRHPERRADLRERGVGGGAWRQDETLPPSPAAVAATGRATALPTPRRRRGVFISLATSHQSHLRVAALGGHPKVPELGAEAPVDEDVRSLEVCGGRRRRRREREGGGEGIGRIGEGFVSSRERVAR